MYNKKNTNVCCKVGFVWAKVLQHFNTGPNLKMELCGEDKKNYLLWILNHLWNYLKNPF